MLFEPSAASSRTTSSTSTAPGYIGRREFLRRGAVVGMSLPLRELPGHAPAAAGRQAATSRRRRAGEQRPTSSRAARSARACRRPGSDLDPIKVNNQGALATLGQSGEFLIYSDSELNAVPRLAESWKPNERRLAVDVQDPPGREVPGRQADDGGGRRGDVQPARRPRRPAPTRCRPSPACSPRAARRRPTRRRSCSSSRRRTATSRSRPPRTTTT